MNREQRKRQAIADERLLERGIDPESHDLNPAAAMIRRIYALLERAKRDKNIDPVVKFLYATTNGTLDRLKTIKVSCKKGCAHCCHTWVSATAPEALFAAKLIRRRQDMAAIERVRAAYGLTKNVTYSLRFMNPTACPMLADNICSIYDSRPVTCRFAASTNVDVCARVFHRSSREQVPVPMPYRQGAGRYLMAAVIALKHAGFPHYCYEYNAALECALSRGDVEEAWLAGEDVFADVQRDSLDVLTSSGAPMLQKQAFG